MPRPLARRTPRALVVSGAALLSALVTGCGAPGAVASRPEQGSWIAPVASADHAHIVAVYQSHCGTCHRPVPPGSEPSDRLQAELVRHRKRARLTEQEWAGLDELLVRR